MPGFAARLALVGFSLALNLASNASEFNPHVIPGPESALPFFEGWFFRIVDHYENRSFAVIVGSFRPEHGSSTIESGNTWTALLYDSSEGMRTSQAFPKGKLQILADNDPVTKNPRPGTPSKFKWMLDGVGHILVNDSTAYMDVIIADSVITANFSRRVPWSKEFPNSAGPEGVMRELDGILPCHYYVQSLRSTVSYTISHAGVSNSGSGALGHMETNYGTVFPRGWIWVQGMQNTTTIMITGGLFVIGGIPTHTFLIGYRDTQRSWDFRTTELDHITTEFDSCAHEANFQLSAKPRYEAKHMGRGSLKVEVTTPQSSFSDRLYFPTKNGFSNSPGAKESYRAQVKITLEDSDGKQTNNIISLAALEFGGTFGCNTKNYTRSLTTSVHSSSGQEEQLQR